jgi:hypothetical protein
VGQDSRVSIATLYGLDGPGIKSQWGARFSTSVQTSLGAHLASVYKGYQVSFLGVERPGCDTDSLTSVTKVKERVELHLYSPSGSSWLIYRVNWTFYTIIINFM